MYINMFLIWGIMEKYILYYGLLLKGYFWYIFDGYLIKFVIRFGVVIIKELGELGNLVEIYWI